MNPGTELVCSSRRAGLPRVCNGICLGQLTITSSHLCQPPLSDAAAKRFILYVQRCLASDSEIVQCITRYGIWFDHIASPVACSAQLCCSKYGFTADDISCVSLNKTAKYYLQNVHPGAVDTAHMLLELIFIRDGSFQVNLPSFEDECIVFIFSYFYQVILFYFSFLLYFVYKFIINIGLHLHR